MSQYVIACAIAIGLCSIFIAILVLHRPPNWRIEIQDWFLFFVFLLLGIAAIVLGSFEIWQLFLERNS